MLDIFEKLFFRKGWNYDFVKIFLYRVIRMIINVEEDLQEEIQIVFYELFFWLFFFVILILIGSYNECFIEYV